MTTEAEVAPASTARAARAWAPLAASWLLMGLELPLISAIIARLPDPRVGLAAYGGVVFPISLMIESPILMLLSASTALSRDERSYRVGRRVMLALGGGFTALHAIVAFTPLYDLIARRLLGVPEDIIEPARWGLKIMTPFTISVAYRRFQQGVLIRFGRAREVGIGTAVRLVTNASVLAFGALLTHWPGIVVGASAVAASVIAEAVFAGLRVRSVRFGALRAVPPPATPLTTARFLRFYLPLMITPTILLAATPLMSAAMSRTPRALDSLATWPALSGFLFTLRSFGFALNEVVVAQLDDPRMWRALRRLGLAIAAVTSTLVLAMAATPLAGLWLGRVSALPPALVALGAQALWFGVLTPATTAMQSLYQGVLLHAHETRSITEAVILYLIVTVAVLIAGVAWGRTPGLPFAVASLTLGGLAQSGWLRWRARHAIARLAAAPGPAQVSMG